MPGFTADAEEPKPVAAPTQEPVVAPVKAPEPAPVKKEVERFQIVETAMSATEGLYIYKIVTNKYLGELGGVYEA